MALLIPFLAFIILWVGFYKRISSKHTIPFRHSFLYAAALWGTAVVIFTESLNLFHAISFWPLLIAWSLFLAAAFWWAFPFKPTLSFSFVLQWSLGEKLLVLLLMGIAGIKGFSAIYSAPNTYDALTYHLPRVEHWIQNGSLNYYPTNVLRQLYSCPFAEFVILHLRILSGSDHFSNAVQWFSGIGAWVGVSALASLLGANRQGQLLAAVLAATLPMGLVQLTSTQTDYVLTIWQVGFVYFLWSTYQARFKTDAIAAGACLGLGMLTKGSVYLFSPVWIVIYLIASSLKFDLKRLGLLGISLVVSIAFIIPYALRNTIAFGKPNWTHEVMTNDHVTPRTIGANMVCNTALHLGTQSEQLNASIKNALLHIAQWIGFDLHKPDTMDRGDPFYFPWMSTGEDDSGNLAFVCLMAVIILAMIFYPTLGRKQYWLYAMAILSMMVIFCAVVRFHPFNSRYHLAIFVLACVLVGTVASAALRRWAWVLGIMMCVLTWRWLLVSNEHALLDKYSILKTSRIEQYFSERPTKILPYALVASQVVHSGCRDIGLIQSEDTMEYPWWVFFNNEFGTQFRLEHVGITNESASLSYPKGNFVPCIIITSRNAPALTIPQGMYVRSWFIDLPDGQINTFIPLSAASKG